MNSLPCILESRGDQNDPTAAFLSSRSNASITPLNDDQNFWPDPARPGQGDGAGDGRDFLSSLTAPEAARPKAAPSRIATGLTRGALLPPWCSE